MRFLNKIVIILFLVCNIYADLSFSNQIKVYTDYQQALQIAKKQHKKLMMFMHTKYCRWCIKMQKTTLQDQKVIDFINKNYIFLSMDKDTGKYPKQYRPRFVPTTYTIDPITEEEIYSLYAYKNAKEFLSELEDF